MVSGPSVVSVVVPAFNAEGSIGKCIDSIKSQDHQNLEIIVVDDGSTDGTFEIASQLSSTDPRVRVIRSAENVGVHKARALGLSHSCGGLIGFVDADDYIESQMYSTLLKAIERTGASIAICSASLISQGNRIGRRIDVRSSKHVRRDILLKFSRMKFGSGVLWNKLYVRDVIEEPALLDSKLEMGEDYVVNFGAFARASTVVLCRQELYNYVVHSSNASGQNGWPALAQLLRSYAVCLEIYLPSQEHLAPFINELYIKQLHFPIYRIPGERPSEEITQNIAESFRRILAVNPSSIYSLLHAVPLWNEKIRRVLNYAYGPGL